MEYMFDEIEPTVKGHLMGYWLLTKPNLNVSKAKSKPNQTQTKTESKQNQNRIRPKPKPNQSPPKDKDKDKDKDKEGDKDTSPSFGHYMDVLDFLRSNGNANSKIEVKFEDMTVKVSTLGKAYNKSNTNDLDRKQETRFLTYLMNNTEELK